MDQSPRLSLPYLAPNQAQKHVTVNEALRRLDALAQLSVVSRTTAAQPASPADGDAYILPASPSGADWGGYAQASIAVYQDGAWSEIAAREGLRAWVAADDELVVYDGAAWAEVSPEVTGADQFGVNASADASNRLTVKSDAVLFSHDDVTPGSGASQLKLNKATAGDTASVLFQTGFSGRAEFGLAGDDDFHVKVSADGATWSEALVIDKTTGGAVFLATDTPLTAINDGASSPTLMLTNYVSSAGGGNFTIRKARGSKASPAAVQSNDIIGGYFTKAYHSGCAFSGNVGFAGFRAHENFTASAQGSSFEIATTSDGATSRTVRGVWHEGLVAGSPAGGDKGHGSISAEAVYDDNTLLSCYVFDAALDGAVDLAKWDAKAPDRRRVLRDAESGEIVSDETERRDHDPARQFAARIGSAHDPLTLDGYAKHWREKRHLTAMPNEATFDPVNGQLTAGEWIQRLVETVEIQAVLIEQLNTRLKPLEGRRR